MELSIGSIVSKIDAVLAKLEGMEKGKARRKQRMTNILGAITEDTEGVCRSFWKRNLHPK